MSRPARVLEYGKRKHSSVSNPANCDREHSHASGRGEGVGAPHVYVINMRYVYKNGQWVALMHAHGCAATTLGTATGAHRPATYQRRALGTQGPLPTRHRSKVALAQLASEYMQVMCNT